MSRISILLVVVLFTLASLAAAKKPANYSNGLQYIGSFTSSRTKGEQRKFSGNVANKRSNVEYTSHLFWSQNAAGFSTAEKDCKARLADDATLLCIETQEELANVTRLLNDHSDDTGSFYWVGGKYDTRRSKFVWTSGVEFGPWAPWASGRPESKLSVTRVAAEMVGFGPGSIKFRTQLQTVSNRYICELRKGPIDEEPLPCYTDNDLVIVLDSSGSIGQKQYTIGLEFVARLAAAWSDNPNNRLSFIVYSSNVHHIFGLNQKLDVVQIRDLVYGAPYLDSTTASDLGLARALEEFQLNGRGNVPRNLVFLTDGESNNPQLTTVAANNIKAAGIRAFSVGIGQWIQQEELLAIAGGRQEHIFNTDGFAELLKLLKPVSLKVCS